MDGLGAGRRGAPLAQQRRGPVVIGAHLVSGHLIAAAAYGGMAGGAAMVARAGSTRSEGGGAGGRERAGRPAVLAHVGADSFAAGALHGNLWPLFSAPPMTGLPRRPLRAK